MRLLRQLSTKCGTAILVVTHDTRMIGEMDWDIHLVDEQVTDDADALLLAQGQAMSKALF